MKTERRVRAALFLGSVAVLLVVCAFLWLINANQSAALRRTHGEYLLILGGLSLLCLGLFFAFAEVFDQDGKIASSLIVTMLVTLLLIMQIALAFSSFTNQNMQFSLGAFARARGIVASLDGADAGDYDGILRDAMTDELAHAAIVDDDGRARYASDPALIGEVLPQDGALSFPLYAGGRLLVRTDAQRQRDMTLETIATQLTLLVTSLLFSVELVMFVIGRVGKMQGGGATSQPAVLTNVRQIAFLFYFGSRLCASFIPLMARELPAPLEAVDPNLIAALPQTCETALTCVAILFTGSLMRRKGWKPPFALGLAFVCLGTLGSAVSNTLLRFALARAVVGLGYGFCWMTLRSLALFGEDDRARMWGFSMLNSGLYAGMFCGSTVGSILAVSIGRPAVLLISAILTALCGAYVLTMENRRLTPETRQSVGDARPTRVSWRGKVGFVAFLLLMVAPTCIAVSYSGYFLPLFYADIGRGTLEVGRAQLIYGLIIVYLGPVLTSWIVRARGSLVLANMLYNGLIAAAFILLGAFGSFGASIAAIAMIGVGDGFGFGVQNNFYLAMPVNRRLGGERALTYMSLCKKLMEMLGPSVFALAMVGSARRGVLALGVIFAACAALYLLIRIPLGTRAQRGA